MAFSRAFLRDAIGDREDAAEVVDRIIDAHVETISPIKAELNRLQEANGGKSAEEVHAELERMTAEIDRLKVEDVDENGIPWKTRYEALKTDFDAFKEKAEAREAYVAKERAFRSMLIQAGVSSHIDLIVRGGGDIINGIVLEDGAVQNSATISAAIRSEFADFIDKGKAVQTYTGAPTRESIAMIADRGERLAAMQRNPHLFRE